MVFLTVLEVKTSNFVKVRIWLEVWFNKKNNNNKQTNKKTIVFFSQFLKSGCWVLDIRVVSLIFRPVWRYACLTTMCEINRYIITKQHQCRKGGKATLCCVVWVTGYYLPSWSNSAFWPLKRSKLVHDFSCINVHFLCWGVTGSEQTWSEIISIDRLWQTVDHDAVISITLHSGSCIIMIS